MSNNKLTNYTRDDRRVNFHFLNYNKRTNEKSMKFSFLQNNIRLIF